MSNRKKVWLHRRNQVFQIIEAISHDNRLSRAYGIVSTAFLLLNLTVTVL